MPGSLKNYCKAYTVDQFRAFQGWPEAGGGESGIDYLFLHDNLVVTRGIFADQDVVYSEISDEWRTFCTDTLNFKVPEYA